MTKLVKGTALYEEVFGGTNAPTTFVSAMPSYADLQTAFKDPAYRSLVASPDLLNSQQATDIRTGMQVLVQDLSVSRGDDSAINIPTAMLAGVRSIVTSLEILPSVTSSQITNKIFATAAVGGKGLGAAAIGVGLAVLGVAVPIVGAIASVIVGLAAAIFGRIQSNQRELDLKKAEDRALLYRTFPNLQQGGSGSDALLVQNSLRPRFASRDWTSIYLPRFTGETWVGVARADGFAFAPGNVVKRSDDFEGDVGEEWVFDHEDTGVGVFPASDRLTAIIQVGLVHNPADPASAAFWSFMTGGPDPRGIDANGVRGWTRVQDTGVFYPATARLAATMWSLALGKANPYKYRLDALRMHEAWERWARGGIQYIRDVCYPWWPKHTKGSGVIDENANLEGFFGTAVFAAVGAWAGIVDKAKSTSQHPVYRVWDAPDGIIGADLPASLNAYGAVGSPVSSTYSGAFLPILDPDNWPDQCMGQIYTRGPNLRGTLEQLQAVQRYELRHTLVSAYVSTSDAAFKGDPKLLELLLSMRQTLLTSEDRMYVDLADVVEDEAGLPSSGKTWRQQLVDSGVPLTTRAAPRLLRMGPKGDKPPPPAPFVPTNPNPWAPVKPKRVGRPSPSGGGAGIAIAGGAALAALGAALAYGASQRNQKRRSFSSGGL